MLKKNKTKKVLTVFSLVMINVALIASLRGLPLMAEYGFSIVFFLLVAVILFLIPSSLISAELATGWPKKGGVYVWVKEALGEEWGFLAIWLQWIQNIVFYPTALAATAAVLAYIFNPALANSAIFTFLVIITVYWGATFFNFKGMKFSSWFSSFGTITGILVPGLILIISAIAWLVMGNPSQIAFTWQSFVPDLSNFQNIVFFSGVILFFAGMEVSATHAQDVENPQKDYPKAILISALIIIGIFLLGAMAIAVIVPNTQISLTAGIMETFEIVFDKFHIRWMIPVLAILSAPGMIAQISTWIAGPSKGLLATADNGDLPKFFQKTNKNGVPINILMVQGSIVTLISMVFLFMPSVSSSFWILTALTAQLYLIMYVLMFISAIKLRYTRPNVVRAFRVPWGNFGMWLVSGVGIIAAIAAIVIGFFPPAQLATGKLDFYEAFLALGLIIMCGVPLLIFHFRKPSWKNKSIKENA